jgi:acetylornithine deacetylase/succinyl-diaminopimelate desuccinylase-like protein
VIKDGKLYGRGGADDGYAIFCAISAINMLKQQKVAHSRIVIVIEASEESGSPDLPHYIDLLKKEIGTPELIVCLDSGCGNYEQLWLTTSLRGCVVGNLKVEVLKEGVHSGMGSGVVPSSFRIMRKLLDRLEDADTGKVLLKEAWCEVPEDQMGYARGCAEAVGNNIIPAMPTVEGMKTTETDHVQLLLNRAWRPQISYTGIGGMPSLAQGGNVLRTHTTVKISMRLPPTVKATPVVKALEKLVTTDVPYGAKVSWVGEKASAGWKAPTIKPWLSDELNAASKSFYESEKGFLAIGQGGSIPFMGMLGEKFPQAQFFITGLLGPGSNAHGPNEFMHIGMFKRVTCCVASVLAKHHQEFAAEPAAKRQK